MNVYSRDPRRSVIGNRGLFFAVVAADRFYSIMWNYYSALVFTNIFIPARRRYLSFFFMPLFVSESHYQCLTYFPAGFRWGQNVHAFFSPSML